MAKFGWKIQYEKTSNGTSQEDCQVVFWPNEPTREGAAILLQNYLALSLDSTGLPKNTPEPTLFLLGRVGYTITEVSSLATEDDFEPPVGELF